MALLLDGGTLDGLGAEAALADEGLRGFVVDGGEGGELSEKLLEEDRREAGDGCGDGGFLGEDDVLEGVLVRGGGVRGEGQGLTLATSRSPERRRQ